MYFDENHYDYEKLVSDIEILKKFKNIQVFTIGKTVLGKGIPLLKIGCGPKHIIYIATHHALEWISSSLLMRFAYNILYHHSINKRYLGYDINELLKKVTLHLVPMLNPDGVDIINNKITDENLLEQLNFQNKNNDFSTTWQANANGVDLNHNYDAGFEKAKSLEYKHNVTGPCNSRYGGLYPESEPEVKALCNYIRGENFSYLIAYHSQGEVIYYDYNGKTPPKSKLLGTFLSKLTGYTLDNTQGISSYGGCKDWFIEKFNKPGFTVELGSGKNPLSFSQFEKIYNDNVESMILLPFLN